MTSYFVGIHSAAYIHTYIHTYVHTCNSHYSILVGASLQSCTDLGIGSQVVCSVPVFAVLSCASSLRTDRPQLEYGALQL